MVGRGQVKPEWHTGEAEPWAHGSTSLYFDVVLKISILKVLFVKKENHRIMYLDNK